MALPGLPQRRPPRRDMQVSVTPESRLDGAPQDTLPGYSDAVEAVSIKMLEDAYMEATPENMAKVRAEAEQYVNDNLQGSRSKQRAVPIQPREPGGGVDPNSYPGGPLSAQDTRLANLPMAEQEAAIDRERGMVDGIVQSSREGRPAYETSPLDQRLEYSRNNPASGAITPEEWQQPGTEYGTAAYYNPFNSQADGVSVTPTDVAGMTDDDVLIDMQRRGIAPLEVTPERIASHRQWMEFINRTPGGEDQYRFNRPGYMENKRRIDDERRQQNAEDRQTYGVGQAGPQLTDEQVQNRQERTAREDRFHDSPAQRESRIERMAARAGISYSEAEKIVDGGRTMVRPPVATPQDAGAFVGGAPPAIGGAPIAASGQNALDAQGVPLGSAERRDEFSGLRRAVRDKRVSDTADRRAKVSQHARLASGQPTGGIGGSRGAVERMNEGLARTDALLARLGQEGVSDWERAGIMAQLAPKADTSNPTPLGVDAVGAANTMRMMNAEAFAGMDPVGRKLAQQQQDIALMGQPPEVQMRVSRQRGEPMGTGLSAGPVQTAWNDSRGWTGGGETGFRRKMEAAGYGEDEITAWIESRSGAPPPSRSGPPPPPTSRSARQGSRPGARKNPPPVPSPPSGPRGRGSGARPPGR